MRAKNRGILINNSEENSAASWLSEEVRLMKLIEYEANKTAENKRNREWVSKKIVNFLKSNKHKGHQNSSDFIRSKQAFVDIIYSLPENFVNEIFYYLKSHVTVEMDSERLSKSPTKAIIEFMFPESDDMINNIANQIFYCRVLNKIVTPEECYDHFNREMKYVTYTKRSDCIADNRVDLPLETAKRIAAEKYAPSLSQLVQYELAEANKKTLKSIREVA